MIGHAARKQRRKRIAAFVKERGGTPESLALAIIEFGVGPTTVRTACREFGVKYERGTSNRMVLNTYRVIADLCNTTRTLIQLAQDHFVTKQRISKIYTNCLSAGVPVNKRLQGKKS